MSIELAATAAAFCCVLYLGCVNEKCKHNTCCEECPCCNYKFWGNMGVPCCKEYTSNEEGVFNDVVSSTSSSSAPATDVIDRDEEPVQTDSSGGSCTKIDPPPTPDRKVEESTATVL